MTVRVKVPSEILQWARARSGIDEDTWTKRFADFDKWNAGVSKPTLRQLEEFARKTYTPVGYFFLDEPPTEVIPVPDFRTIGDRPLPGGATANLLDTLNVCLARQEWYHDNQLLHGEPPLDFVGMATLQTEPAHAAATMRELLAWTPDVRNGLANRGAAVTALRESAEALGVLVMISGIVGSNTHRRLDPNEFRGFALVDQFAPLVFVNGSDSKSAQVFTLAHELAHLWLGSTALSDVEPASVQDFSEERWCNQVAVELLVPMGEFEPVFDRAAELRPQLQPLAERFLVSTQVILGRVREMGALSWDEYLAELRFERERVAMVASERTGGGNYYTSKPVQVSKRFARELIASTLEGRTTYTEAFRLLGVKKTSTFEGLGQQLGVL